VLRGARGPGQTSSSPACTAQTEYTGVVDGMSGSPVYIDGKLVGALSYRIGQSPGTHRRHYPHRTDARGARPVRADLAVAHPPPRKHAAKTRKAWETTHPIPALRRQNDLHAHGNPLVLSGFRPEAIRFWQQQTAGTALENVAAGGVRPVWGVPPRLANPLKPGTAFTSARFLRQHAAGSRDVEVAATCTITYIDPRQLLACGHPVLGSGPVSLPMTTTDVITTVASPLDAFKIINTGVTSALHPGPRIGHHGVFGAQARMIPMHISIDVPTGDAPPASARSTWRSSICLPSHRSRCRWFC